MTCDDCGKEIVIGEWPYCPHGHPSLTKGFEPYFDDNLQVQITNPGDRNKAMRPYWENDHIVRIEPKERPAGYFRELNDRRRERVERERRERR